MASVTTISPPEPSMVACQPCWERKQRRVSATRLAGRTPMCEDCYSGDMPGQTDRMIVRLDKELGKIRRDIEAQAYSIQQVMDMLHKQNRTDPHLANRSIDTVRSEVTAYLSSLPVCPVRPKRARHIAMYLCRQMGYSYPAIGRRFGWMHHTSVMYACEKMARLEANDLSIRDLVNHLRAQFELESPCKPQ